MDPKRADLFIPGKIAVHILRNGDEVPEGWRVTPTGIPGLYLAWLEEGGSNEDTNGGRPKACVNEWDDPGWWQKLCAERTPC